MQVNGRSQTFAHKTEYQGGTYTKEPYKACRQLIKQAPARYTTIRSQTATQINRIVQVVKQDNCPAVKLQ